MKRSLLILTLVLSFGFMAVGHQAACAATSPESAITSAVVGQAKPEAAKPAAAPAAGPSKVQVNRPVTWTMFL
ncbi:MAG: hypothetical protein V2B18_07085, partial [Pseudomonadota bacterium]